MGNLCCCVAKPAIPNVDVDVSHNRCFRYCIPRCDGCCENDQIDCPSTCCVIQVMRRESKTRKK